MTEATEYSKLNQNSFPRPITPHATTLHLKYIDLDRLKSYFRKSPLFVKERRLFVTEVRLKRIMLV